MQVSVFGELCGQLGAAGGGNNKCAQMVLRPRNRWVVGCTFNASVLEISMIKNGVVRCSSAY